MPKTKGELVRCAYESLALKYRQVLAGLEELTGNRIEVIHIVGGGSKSEILNQFTGDACQRPVVTGPVEATAMGNLLTQIRASGELDTLADLRAVLRKSAEVKRYAPGSAAAWEDAAGRLAKGRERHCSVTRLYYCDARPLPGLPPFPPAAARLASRHGNSDAHAWPFARSR